VACRPGKTRHPARRRFAFATMMLVRNREMMKRMRDLLGALAITACWLTTAGADTWAERLGYPADAKVLILHAGELGLSYETNAAGMKLLESGAVRSAAAMAPAPWFADLAQWAKAHPDADVGLELTLNSELKNYRWQPVASEGLVPSLVDSDGYLWRHPVQTSANAATEDAEYELRAQIARAKAAGLRPTHLTSHLGGLFERPDLIGAYLRIAREEWIPAAIVRLTAEQLDHFIEAGNPVPNDVLLALDEYPLPKLDALRFVPDGETYDAKKQALLAMIAELPPGITQIEFRPAAVSDALPRIADDAQQRIWDAELLVDQDVIRVLQGEGIVLTDWREIMRRFEGEAPVSDEAAPATNVQPQ
jgi:chitin disaccharide deacetylase